jgi:hypothetical protein
MEFKHGGVVGHFARAVAKLAFRHAWYCQPRVSELTTEAKNQGKCGSVARVNNVDLTFNVKNQL